MIITANSSSDFEPHPEADCIGVCVDITPPKEFTSSWGTRKKFKVVFESEALRDDGHPYLVWSQPFTLSLYEKAAFRQFLEKWFGRALTPTEQEGFETETLIGRTARLSIVHAHHNGSTFANIGLIRPDNTDDPPLQPCGDYIRMKDREGAGSFDGDNPTSSEASNDQKW